jgi:predicted nucleotidyltransferase
MDCAGIEKELRQFFSTRPRDLVAVYLFGSVARGTAGARSDVDVGVLHARPPPKTLEGLPFSLEEELELRLGIPVQVVILNTAPVDLVHRVLRDGKLLLEQDRSARIAFEVKARNEYFDLEPILRLYRRMEKAPSDR